MARREQLDPTENPKTGETRATDAMTVCWMIAVMQTFLLELATIAVRWYTQLHPEQERAVMAFKLLYLSAALGGCISLLLLLVVFRLRRVPPPKGVTAFATIVGALPILTLLLGVGQ
jgi:hypothetical protein